MLTSSHFVQTANEFKFLSEYVDKYKSVPDKETFISKFPNWSFINVNEPTRALIDVIREEELFRRGVKVFNETSAIFEKDANEGAKHLIQAVKDLEPNYTVSGLNVAKQARERFEEWDKKVKQENPPFIPIKFKELNDVLYGLQRGNDLIVFNSRISNGKRVWYTNAVIG